VKTQTKQVRNNYSKKYHKKDPEKEFLKSGCDYPSRPGCVGLNTLEKPKLLAIAAVVSPMHATELFHSKSERRFFQALLQQSI